jgi:hypothetical protein
METSSIQRNTNFKTKSNRLGQFKDMYFNVFDGLKHTFKQSVAGSSSLAWLIQPKGTSAAPLFFAIYAPEEKLRWFLY